MLLGEPLLYWIEGTRKVVSSVEQEEIVLEFQREDETKIQTALLRVRRKTERECIGIETKGESFS